MKRSIEIIEVNAPWVPVEKEVSLNYKEFIEANIESYAMGHLEGWRPRYEGKSLSDIRFDLGVNYDLAGEVECIEDIYINENNGCELNELEVELTQNIFIDKVVELREKEVKDLLS